MSNYLELTQLPDGTIVLEDQMIMKIQLLKLNLVKNQKTF